MVDMVIKQLLMFREYAVICIIIAITYGLIIWLMSNKKFWSVTLLRFISITFSMRGRVAVKLACSYLAIVFIFYFFISGQSMEKIYIIYLAAIALTNVFVKFWLSECLVLLTGYTLILASMVVYSSIRSYLSNIRYSSGVNILSWLLAAFTMVIALIIFLWELKNLSGRRIPTIDGQWNDEEEENA